jgi:hypothetical protein
MWHPPHRPQASRLAVDGRRACRSETMARGACRFVTARNAGAGLGLSFDTSPTLEVAMPNTSMPRIVGFILGGFVAVAVVVGLMTALYPFAQEALGALGAS